VNHKNCSERVLDIWETDKRETKLLYEKVKWANGKLTHFSAILLVVIKAAALGNGNALKLPKCRLQFKNKLIMSESGSLQDKYVG